MNMRCLAFFTFLLFALQSFGQGKSASKIPKDVETALALAGNNRAEMEKVLLYYSRTKNDSAQYKAACYLISNMKWHRSTCRTTKVDTAFLNIFHLADSLYYNLVIGRDTRQIDGKEIKEGLKKIKQYIQDSLHKMTFQEPVIEALRKDDSSDLNIVKANFLIDHINNAFEIRASSDFVQQLSFENFCEYILPYRLLDGKNFRANGKMFHDFFSKYIGDPNKDSLPELVGRYNRTVINLRDIFGNYPLQNRTGFEELFFHNVRGFDCFSISNYCGAALNACGIPVDIELTVAWADMQGRHSQCKIPDILGNWDRFSPESGVPTRRDIQYQSSGLKVMNLYRVYFSIQKNAPFFLKEKEEFIPEIFNDPTIQDVTNKSVKTIPLTLSFNEQTTNNYAYLFTFNSATGITPVSFAKINKSKLNVEFGNTILDRLYFPIFYKGNVPTCFGRPFYLKLDSLERSFYKIVYLDNEESDKATTDLMLTRKFPRKPNMVSVAQNLIGTTLYAFDTLPAKGSSIKGDTLYTLDFAPMPYVQQISLNNRKAHKYYRIEAPIEHHNMNLSEVYFLTENRYGYANSCDAPPVSVLSPKDKSKDLDTSLVWIFDGDLENLSQKSQYDGRMETAPSPYSSITLSLKEPEVVTALRFAPLNANNGIVRGNDYVLYYLENGKWISFGDIKTAEYEYLEFKNVPKGKLYWLKNLSGGKEELPFFVDEKGEQKFLYEEIK